MSTAAYDNAIAQLNAASAGTYPGPAIAPGHVAREYASVSQHDTGPLRLAGASLSPATDANAAGVLSGPLVNVLISVFSGLASNWLSNRVGEWKDAKQGHRSVGHDTESCAASADRITDITGKSIAQILRSLDGTIGQLTAYLRTLHPVDDAATIGQCVAEGSNLIDSAGRSVLDICSARKTQLSGCYEELICRAQACCPPPVCAPPPMCQLPPAPAPCPVPAPEPVPTAPASGGYIKPIGPGPGEGPTYPPSSVPPAPPAPPAPSIPPVQEPPGTESVPPRPPAPPTAACTGVLGAVGLGVGLLAVGGLVHLGIQNGMIKLPDCPLLHPSEPPAPTPPPPPPPEPAPERPTAPAPPSPPPPLPPPIEKDLSRVPEPPPPAEKLAHLQKCVPVCSPAPEPQHHGGTSAPASGPSTPTAGHADACATWRTRSPNGACTLAGCCGSSR